MLKISTLRGSRSTSTPARANSYSRLPWCLRALYMGGTCMMTPQKGCKACSTSLRVKWVQSPVAVTSPSES